MPSPLIQLKKHPPALQDGDSPLEWLVTNGLGGYASGSIAGPPLRRFHGLLIAAHPAPVGRLLLLHHLDETIGVDGHADVVLRPGSSSGPTAHLADFYLQAGLPHWQFTYEGVEIERAVFMPHEANTVHVRYRLSRSASPVRLSVRPWLDFRPHEGTLTPRQAHQYRTDVNGPAACEFTRAGLAISLRMRVSESGAALTEDEADWHDIVYPIERDRGYEFTGSMHSPGTFEVTLQPDTDVYVSASSEPWARFDALPPGEAWAIETARRERLVAASDPALQTAETFLLPLAADQFVVRPATREDDEARVRAAGGEPRTVVAGYPWFTDWGRDTMISLEGLTLVTGRHAEARDVIRTFAHHVRQGLIPNLFPEGAHDGVYHTADATLWFFHALDRYDAITGDHTLVKELLPTMESLVDWHRRGTLFNIRIDEDGLLTQGAPDLQLTWMDAKVGDWVVTPRRGKAVELSALWHNALVLLSGWLARDGRGLLAEELVREAQRCRDAFNARFWNPDTGYLFDVVDGEQGDDAACRPNQVIAVAVPHSPLARERWESVVDAVATELLTPMGLRTLSPTHRDYQSRYVGDLRARDAAYHQGTVWPWLIGPFVDAWLAVRPSDAEGARELLVPLLQHLMGSGSVGSISEVFDAQAPSWPRGCTAQAWSIAEVARAIVKVERFLDALGARTRASPRRADRSTRRR